MSELDDKLNSILSNPQMMQQIMTLAQSLGGSDSSQQQTGKTQESPANQMLNPSILSKVGSLMQRGTIDKDQQSLLRALTPYLSRQKLQKLERAMYAAKMAGIASEMVGSRGGNSFFGR